MSTQRLTTIVREERGITADTALRSSRFFGTTTEFWMNPQSFYDRQNASNEKGAATKTEVHALLR
jgi:addiction module HigA family antidote